MEELLAKMAGLLQDIYDEGHGGEFRPSIQEVLVRYNAAQQSVHADAGDSAASSELVQASALSTSQTVTQPPQRG